MPIGHFTTKPFDLLSFAWRQDRHGICCQAAISWYHWFVGAIWQPDCRVVDDDLDQTTVGIVAQGRCNSLLHALLMRCGQDESTHDSQGQDQQHLD